VVDLHPGVRVFAQLAPSGLKPGDQLFSPDGDRGGDVVGEDRVPFSP
jgi:hypothetical protein